MIRTAIFAAIVLAVALVAISPLGLRAMPVGKAADWGLLSDIGQTYGAVSSLLSTLALVGVAASVILQLRETRFNRIEASRTRQHELIRLAMENPSYLDIFDFPQGATSDTKKHIAFINLFLQFYQMLWEFSDVTEFEVKTQVGSILSTEVGRDYWQRYGPSRIQAGSTKKQREFERIIDSVYKQAIQANAVIPTGSQAKSIRYRNEARDPSKRHAPGTLLGAAFISGLMIGWRVRNIRTWRFAQHRGQIGDGVWNRRSNLP